jgi:hypothetical protein
MGTTCDRRRTARALGVLFLAAMLLAYSGCSGGQSDSGASGSGEPGTGGEGAAVPGLAANGEASTEDESDGSWFEGEWSVVYSLETVSPDADWSRQAADQTYAEWSCKVNGTEMMISTGPHVYTGTLSVDPVDQSWLYDGSADYLDEYGEMWTSHIVVEGTRTERGFAAEQWGEISSDSDGILYTATWSAVGTEDE